MSILFFFFYNNLIYPFILGVAYLLSFSNSKIHKGFLLRKKINGQFPWMNLVIKNPILIHCASGEFEYAKPLIREIKKKSPEVKILVTYFSPSYVKQIEAFEGVDALCPLPWDCARTVKEFLDHVEPTKILISRTDLWPEFLRQAQLKNIPVILYSALLSSKSSKIRNPIIRFLYSSLIKNINTIFCVSQEDKESFLMVAPKEKLHVVGDTRFDQVFYRILNRKTLKNIFNNRTTFICGSTWPEDEAVLIPVFSDILRQGLQIIIAPHEPSENHIKDLEGQFQKLGLRSKRYSQIVFWETNDILIIDQVGILADLYGHAQFAFVGGSFKKQIHSVMEALAQGCITYYGPFYHNNREAIDFLKITIPIDNSNIQIGNTFKNGQELLRYLQQHKNLDHIRLCPQIRERIYELTGASERLAKLI